MAQFGAGKNPPWARTSAEFAGAAMTQQMLTPGVATQAVYNLAAQQNLQSQFQAQQMAAATMQVQTMQQQAMLPQPGIAMPTSLASANLGAISYPTLKTQQQQQQQQHATAQPKQRVFTGSVTKLHDNFGFVDEDVFFQTTCVKGQMPKVGDRVLVEAQFNANMPFKWNATCVKVLNYQTSGVTNLPGSKPPALMDTTSGRTGRVERSRSGGRSGFDRERERERSRRREERERRERRKSEEKEKEVMEEKEKRKRSRSPRKSSSPASVRRSRSPVRRRPRIIPRYVVQVPKVLLNMKEASVVTLKTRYSNMYIPSDFYHAEFPWHEAFPLLRPFQLGKSCTFHVMHKEVDRVGANTAVLDPPDADHLYSAKVMLISCPSLDDLYHKSCSLSQDAENIQENFVHPTRLINFLVGVKGKNEPIAIGGPWSPSLDGANPGEDPKVLIKTAIRTTKALTGINLSACTQWYRVAEVRYLRPEEYHKGRLVPARVETSVIYLPDVWSCEPTHFEWETLQNSYKKQLQRKLAQLEGKEEEEEEGGDDALGEKKDPTHHSELDPKSMKILDLRRELECRNVSSKGLKSQLIARLTKQLKTEQETEEETAATKAEEVKEEPPEEEVKMETEEDEEKKKKEEEERKKDEERKKATLERRYTLPDKRSILVYPNPTAKGGKFDCSVMSLSVLLDYRPEDNKEHSFEVSLFAELFNEMLMRDFGFTMYKSLSAVPEKPKEEKKDKDKDKDKKKDDEPAAKKKKTDDKDKKDSDKKEEDTDKKESKDSPDKKDDKKDEDKDKKDERKKDKDEKEKKKEKRKFRTVKADLLLACIYFDQNHCGYILDKDIEEIIHAIGLSLSRAQVKKLLTKVVSRDTFSYRKLTDEAIGEEDKSTEPKEIEVDLEVLAAGNCTAQTVNKESTTTPSKRKSTKNDNETLTGMVMYNGAMLDIDSLLQRLSKGEQSMEDFEKKVQQVEEEREQIRKDLKKKEDACSKLTSELKSVKQELSVQAKITSSSQSNNRKYLSALMETHSLVSNLATTVTGALGEMASIKIEKTEGVPVKEEKIENGTD